MRVLKRHYFVSYILERDKLLRNKLNLGERDSSEGFNTFQNDFLQTFPTLLSHLLHNPQTLFRIIHRFLPLLSLVVPILGLFGIGIEIFLREMFLENVEDLRPVCWVS